MRTLTLGALAAAVVLGLSGAAMAQMTKPAVKAEKPAEKPVAKPDAKKGGLQGEFAAMAYELNLSEAQKAKLEDVINSREAASKRWNETNGAKERQLREAMQAARQSGDKARLTSLSAESDALARSKDEIRKKFDADMDALLTPEQRQQQAGFELYREVKQGLAKANLTDSQIADVKARCQGAAAAISRASDAKSKSQIKTSLRDAINTQVLTAQQRSALGITAEKAKGPAPTTHNAKPAKKN